MVDFVKKRLQVFVSSTFTDLIEERQAAVEAILTAGHIPAGMELFSAGDESQLEVIKQWIDESDIYLLILGGRYGSVEKNSGKSYTQIEYEYALSKNKPLFACVIDDNALEEKVRLAGRAVVELNEPQKLNVFRELVTSKVVRFWKDSKDIKIAVIEKLTELSRSPQLIGWTRQNTDFSLLASELSRLSQENSQLRHQAANQTTNDFSLPFTTIVQELKRKDLLNFFLHRRERFLGIGYTMDENDEFDKLLELKIFDLVTVIARRWQLTEFGRKFLAKYELDIDSA